MKRFNRLAHAFFAIICCLPLAGFDFYSKLKNEEGNRHYQKGRVGKAKTSYESALKATPSPRKLHLT